MFDILNLVFAVLLLIYGLLSQIHLLPGVKRAGAGFISLATPTLILRVMSWVTGYNMAVTIPFLVITLLYVSAFVTIFLSFLQAGAIPGNIFALGGSVLFIAYLVLSYFFAGWLSAIVSYLSYILLMFASFTEGQKDKG